MIVRGSNTIERVFSPGVGVNIYTRGYRGGFVARPPFSLYLFS